MNETNCIYNNDHFIFEEHLICRYVKLYDDSLQIF